MGAAMFLELTIWRLFEYGGGRPSLNGTESRPSGLLIADQSVGVVAGSLERFRSSAVLVSEIPA